MRVIGYKSRVNKYSVVSCGMNNEPFVIATFSNTTFEHSNIKHALKLGFAERLIENVSYSSVRSLQFIFITRIDIVVPRGDHC